METTIRKNNAFEILTPTGWSNFDGIKKTSRKEQVIIKLVSGLELVCTPEHRIKTNNGLKFSIKLLHDDLIETKTGFDEILELSFTELEGNFYDPINVNHENLYFSNRIISHNCEFLGSSGTLIAGWKLKELAANVGVPIHSNLGMFQYEKPIEGRRYSVTCDVSRGRGLDYSTMQVVDVTTMPYKQVCSFRDNLMTPFDFAEVVYRTAKSYNEATVLIELNDLGEQVAHHIYFEYEYENLLHTESAGNKGKRISAGFGKGRKDKGLTITKTTKAVGCAIMKLLIEGNKLELVDATTINELATFSRKLDTYKAEDGKHDDMVMPLVVFAWLSDQEYFKEYTDINTLDLLREKTEEQMMEELTPFGFFDEGPVNEDPNEIKTVNSLSDWMRDEPV